MASLRYVSPYRFRVAVGAYAIMLLVATVYVIRPFGTELDAFATLLGMFMLAGVALWPRSDGENSVDRKLARRNWSDRIAFEADRGPSASGQG